MISRPGQRVEKVFFDTLETVEKATKPSEPHDTNQKPKEKLQVTERLFCEKCRALTVRGVFRQSNPVLISRPGFVYSDAESHSITFLPSRLAVYAASIISVSAAASSTE